MKRSLPNAPSLLLVENALYLLLLKKLQSHDSWLLYRFLPPSGSIASLTVAMAEKLTMHALQYDSYGGGPAGLKVLNSLFFEWFACQYALIPAADVFKFVFSVWFGGGRWGVKRVGVIRKSEVKIHFTVILCCVVSGAMMFRIFLKITYFSWIGNRALVIFSGII